MNKTSIGGFEKEKSRLRTSGLLRKQSNASPLGKQRKRRKKGEITKLKEQLWQLCRQIQLQKYGRVCYTCGKSVPEGKGLHLGHYITSSLCSIQLRYDLRNLRPQCYHDNINLSGNWPAYKTRIEAELGAGITEQLLAENEATKGKVYPTEWFIEKIDEYTRILGLSTQGF